MKKGFMVLLLLMILAACSKSENIEYEYEYTFNGEGENWEGEYLVKGTEIWGEEDGRATFDSENSNTFILKYKGSLKEMSSIKHLKYAYEAASGSGDGTIEFNEPPTDVIVTSGTTTGGARVREDVVIQVSVKWDEFEEEFELRVENK